MIRYTRTLAVALAAALLAGCTAKSADDAATPSAAPRTAAPATAAPRTAAPATAAPRTAAPATAAPPTAVPTTAAAPPTTAPKVAAARPAPVRDPAIPDGVPIAANDAPPKIVAIVQSPVRLEGGAQMTFDVTTSSNVASVELRAQTFGRAMTRTRIGKFTFSSTVPPLPPLVPHTFAVSFIARNAAGVRVTQTISVTIH